MSGSWRIRAALLVLAGALLVHEARFGLVPADVGDRHGYLSWVGPLLAALVLLAGLELGLRVRRALRGGAAVGEPPSGRRLWPLLSLLLLATFAGQEAAEFLVAQGAGHHAGLEHLFGHGAWLAIPLSVLFGGCLALVLRGAGAVVAWAAARRARPRPSRAHARAARVPHAPAVAPRNLLASFLACRPPPALSA